MKTKTSYLYLWSVYFAQKIFLKYLSWSIQKILSCHFSFSGCFTLNVTKKTLGAEVLGMLCNKQFKYWARSKLTREGMRTGISRTHQDADLEQKYECPSGIFSPFTKESVGSVDFCVLKLLLMNSFFIPSMLYQQV